MLDLGDPVRQPLHLPLGSWAPECLDVPRRASPQLLGWGHPQLRAQRGEQFWQPESSPAGREPVCQVGSASSLQGGSGLRVSLLHQGPRILPAQPHIPQSRLLLWGDSRVCAELQFSKLADPGGAPRKHSEWAMPERGSASFFPVTEPGVEPRAQRQSKGLLPPAGKDCHC